MMAVITRAASSTAKQSAAKGKGSALAAPERATAAKKAKSTSTSSSPSSSAAPGRAASSRQNKSRTGQAHDDNDPAHVTRTPDGRFIIVNNRRWRATDPLIPDAQLAQLKHHLAKGRSGTRVAKGKGREEADAAVKLARQRTGIAKHGLGERGKPEWWNDSEEGRRMRWEDALKDLEELAKDDG